MNCLIAEKFFIYQEKIYQANKPFVRFQFSMIGRSAVWQFVLHILSSSSYLQPPVSNFMRKHQEKMCLMKQTHQHVEQKWFRAADYVELDFTVARLLSRHNLGILKLVDDLVAAWQCPEDFLVLLGTWNVRIVYFSGNQ